MAFTNQTPITENFTGSNCTGSDGTADRTYTLSTVGALSSGVDIVVNGTTLHEGVSNDFTLSGQTVTFLNIIDNTDIIRINYFVSVSVSSSITLSTSTDLEYSTPLLLAEMLGIKSDIPSWDNSSSPTKEEVGTGDNSTTVFYLNMKSVLSDSYTIYYGSAETTTSTLTETTHYEIDLDKGKLTLTSAGVTLLGVNKIYAEYSYINNGMKNSYLITVLNRAENEVDNKTNTTFTDSTATNPPYHSKTEIQSSPGYFNDLIYLDKKPLIDIETTLDGAHNDSITTISLSTGSGSTYPSTGTIIIGSEAITYTGISTDDLTGCTRGALGTTASSHDDGDIIHSTILFLSNTSEGTAVTWTVQPWNTKTYITENGLAYSFADSVFSGSQYPDRMTKEGVANRVKIIYYYGNNLIPSEITRLTLLYAKRMLIQDNIGKSMISGRDEFRPEMFNADLEEMQRIVDAHIIFPMENT